MGPSLMFRRAALAGAVIALALPSGALATTQQGQQMMRNWTQADRCSAQAQKQFPDFTAEAIAKRDLALQQCLSNSILAPRAPQAPQGQGPSAPH